MSSLLTSLLSTFGKQPPKPSVQKPKKEPPKEVQKVTPTPPASNAKLQELSAALEAQKLALQSQEQELARRLEGITAREQYLDAKRKEVDELRAATDDIRQKTLDKLERVSGLTRDKAKAVILEAVDKKITKDIAERLREAETKIKDEVEVKAREILIDAMYHGATEYVAEYTLSTVKLGDDEAKGRIIGKDGRNIRAFEKATGVDIDMDETPGEIRLSSYDSVRREVARVALERLIKDGRIQPTRIEEYVAKARRDIEKIMYEEGKKLCHAVGAYNVAQDLIAMLGRFKYRSSYGQNMLAHTLEETKMGMKLASEVGANVDIVRLGCLFHDIGKVVTNEEGSHIELGVKLLEKYNMDKRVVRAVAEHHEDEEFSSKESILVYIADAISGARPGARYENYEEYVKRLRNIEDIALAQKGVTEAYAILAGREVRVIVSPELLSDDETVRLASRIRDEIKAKVTYPGTVTVTAVRETRAQAVAK